ncbi:hypothetical protein AMECASPLE_003899 [Ameca splendens]|uniref:Uncharacterized protein n=1 Tax=Ameca splendens TaxID=208324 RepID=A0ABV0XBR8_9TELE
MHPEACRNYSSVDSGSWTRTQLDSADVNSFFNIERTSHHGSRVNEEVKTTSVKCSLQAFQQHSNCSFNCCPAQ